jgi:CRP-like cAMP-binding protein
MTDSADETIRSTIDASPLFKHLSEEWRSRLVSASDLQSYASGESVIREGQTEDHPLYLIVGGQARVWTRSDDQAVELKTLFPGASFGEVSLVSDQEPTATVEAKTDELKVLALDHEELVALLEEDDKVRRLLEGLTLARAKDTLDKVAD